MVDLGGTVSVGFWAWATATVVLYLLFSAVFSVAGVLGGALAASLGILFQATLGVAAAIGAAVSLAVCAWFKA